MAATLSIFTILTIRTIHLSCSCNRTSEQNEQASKRANKKRYEKRKTSPKNMARSISNGSLEKGRRKMAIDQPTNEKKKMQKLRRQKMKMKIKRIVTRSF